MALALPQKTLQALGMFDFYPGCSKVQISGEEPEVIFAWQPLYGAPCSFLQRKLGPSMETFATKTGPDCIALQPEQVLETGLEYPNGLTGY